jgi:AcrR family transcriptional regulator
MSYMKHPSGEGSESIGARRPRARSSRGQGSQLREDLLVAAVRHLSGLGSDEPLSLRAVALEAGVTPNAVYLHFADRNELLVSVLERLFAQLADVCDEAERAVEEAGGSAWDKLKTRSLAYVSWGLREPGSYRVLYEGRAVPRLSDPHGLTFGQGMLDRTIELVAELEAHGRAAPVQTPTRTGLLIWVAMHGIVSLRIDKDTIPWPDATELATQAIEALVRPMLLDEDAASPRQ